MKAVSHRPARLLGALAAVSALCVAGAFGPSVDVATAAPAHQRVAPPPTVGLFSGFDYDIEGWTAFYSGSSTGWSNSGGRPGGNAFVQGGSGVPLLVSPSSWGGNRLGLRGGTVSFDLKLSAGGSISYLYIGLKSSDPGLPLIYVSLANPAGTGPNWKHFSFAIKTKGLWMVDATTGARYSDFTTVLSQLTSVQIGVTAAHPTDVLYLDNVKLASKVAVKTSIGYQSKRFFGKLTPGGGCAKKRTVSLHRVRPGPDAGAGTTRTTKSGEWSIYNANPRAGTYYATVKGGFVKGGGDCSAARSRSLKRS